MSRALVIPDVHLKSKLFDRAEDILRSGQADFAVQLGDLVDDWDMEFATSFYRLTMVRAIEFQEAFPNTLWCMGNHDFGYYNREYGRRETGHSRILEDEMTEMLEEFRNVGIEQKIAHCVDNVIFSHAGITKSWINRQKQLTAFPEDRIMRVNDVLELTNHASVAELWREDSPIWARPPEDGKAVVFELWSPSTHTHVVGHTPVSKVTHHVNLLCTDVFSTYSNGAPLGEEKFVIVDTKTRNWEYAKEEK